MTDRDTCGTPACEVARLTRSLAIALIAVAPIQVVAALISPGVEARAVITLAVMATALAALRLRSALVYSVALFTAWYVTVSLVAHGQMLHPLSIVMAAVFFQLGRLGVRHLGAAASPSSSA